MDAVWSVASDPPVKTYTVFIPFIGHKEVCSCELADNTDMILIDTGHDAAPRRRGEKASYVAQQPTLFLLRAPYLLARTCNS